MTAKSSWVKTKRRKALAPAAPPRELVEPTADEKRNGWTAETLTAYREQIAPEIARLFERRKPAMPTRANRYHPHRWRAGR
jgi:hypothetical protein